MGAGVGLEEWAGRASRRRVTDLSPERLRFAFYGRVSTEDWQDPASARARQREQAGALVRGHGTIVKEFFDTGESWSAVWARRPQAAALVAQLDDEDRGWDAVVMGEYERRSTAASMRWWCSCSSIKASSCGCRRPAARWTSPQSTTSGR